MPDFDLATLKRLFSVPKRVTASDAQMQLLESGQRGSHRDGEIAVEHWTFGKGCRRIVLAHGWNSRGAQLGEFVSPLVDAGFSVTLFDAPAHGTSPGAVSSVIHFGRSLLSLCRALGSVHGVIGHSAGSAATLWALNNGLMLQASVHLSGPSSFTPVLRNFLKDNKASHSVAAAFLQWVEGFTGQPVREGDLESLKYGLLHSGLIVHDESDPMVPIAASEALHKAWPFSHLLRTQHLGHTRILRDPEVVKRSVQFITRGYLVG